MSAWALSTAGIIILTAFPSASAQFAPGSGTSGDPYFPAAGDGGYHAADYDLDLSFVPDTGRLTGVATMRATATQSLSRFDEDLSGLKVSRVSVDGRRAVFSQSGGKVIITPVHGNPIGTRFTVVTHYAGTPQSDQDAAFGTYGWVPTNNGAVALPEPDGASTWYPVNDSIDDKATYRIQVTVPAGLTAMANGTEVAAHGNTTTWVENHPMAPYLATVAIGDFKVQKGMAGRIPIVTAVDPSVATQSGINSATAAVLGWETGLLGRYPFDSAGGVVASALLGYGVETQTRPIYAGFDPDNVTIAHDLAEQWFGDSVTPETWRDVWLNEGFATYMEWLWSEQHGGQTAAEHFAEEYGEPADSPLFTVEPGNPGRNQIFGPAVYDRGAMALQELRNAVGDHTFFAILRAWVRRYRDRVADTADFVALARKMSGKALGPMFHSWLYTTGKPSI
jgi:aminopeptidase N